MVVTWMPFGHSTDWPNSQFYDDISNRQMTLNQLILEPSTKYWDKGSRFTMHLNGSAIDFPVTDESIGYNLLEINTAQVQLRTVLVSVSYGGQIINHEEINSKLCIEKTTKQLILKPPTLKPTSSGQCDYYIILVAITYNSLRYYGYALVPIRVSTDSTKRRAEDYKSTCEKHATDFVALMFLDTFASPSQVSSELYPQYPHITLNVFPNMGFPNLIVDLHCDWDLSSLMTSQEILNDVRIVWNKPPSYQVYRPKEVQNKIVRAVVPPGTEGERAHIFLINSTHVLSSETLFIYAGVNMLNQTYSVIAEDAKDFLIASGITGVENAQQQPVQYVESYNIIVNTLNLQPLVPKNPFVRQSEMLPVLIGLFGIPKDIFQLITNQLDEKTLLKTSLLCKAWKDHIESIMLAKCEQNRLDLRILETELPNTTWKKRYFSTVKNAALRLRAQYGDYFNDRDDVQWDRNVTFYETPKMIKGSIESVLNHLTNPEIPDIEFLNVILCCANRLFAVETLLDKVYEVYSNALLRPHKVRMVHILKTWITKYRFKLSYPSKLPYLEEIINKLEPTDKMTLFRSLQEDFFSPPIAFPVSISIGLPNGSASEIAAQICLLEQDLLQRINTNEFQSMAWAKDSARAPTLRRAIARFNRFSYWISEHIVQVNDIDRRVDVIKHFIAIGQELMKLNNMNSLMWLVCGLEMAAVRRLSRTWVKLPKKYQKQMEELRTLVDSAKSFKNMRDYMAKMSLPGLSYMGFMLRNLTFIDEGSADIVSELVDVRKLYLTYNIITTEKIYWDTPYPFERNNELLSYFCNIENSTSMSEDQLYRLSLTIEPRNQ